MVSVGAAAVRTVLGDVEPGGLGACDAHDHLFLRSPQLPGQELDSVAAAAAELAAFRAEGGRSVVQWTPHGMGRRAADLPGLERQARGRAGTHDRHVGGCVLEPRRRGSASLGQDLLYVL